MSGKRTGRQAIARTVRGAAHERSGTPNQDAGAAVALDDAVVLAIADGHGDPLHRRSDRGSRFAVDAAIETVSAWLAAAASLDDAAVRRSAAGLPARLTTAWNGKVAADLAAHPQAGDGEPALRGEAQRQVEACPALLYGSTLATAGLNDRLGLFVQIGDGDILSLGRDDAVLRMASGRRDLPSNVTESLCQPDAQARFRVQLVFYASDERPALVMLSTDGYVNSYEDDQAFFKVARDLRRYLSKDGPEAVAERLEPWLAETSKAGSGDDITLALMWHPQDSPPRHVKRRRAGRRALLIAMVLLAALVVAPIILSTAFPETWLRTGIPALAQALVALWEPAPTPAVPPARPGRGPAGYQGRG